MTNRSEDIEKSIYIKQILRPHDRAQFELLKSEYLNAAVEFDPLLQSLSDSDQHQMYQSILDDKGLSNAERLEGVIGVLKFLNGIFPNQKQEHILEKVYGLEFVQVIRQKRKRLRGGFLVGTKEEVSGKTQKRNIQKEPSLSSGIRGFLTTALLIILLIWGPIEPYGLIVRTGYLIILPILFWFLLEHLGRKWNFSNADNDRLSRTIAGVVAGAFFIGAILAFNAPYHAECTQSVQTREGSECVGDYVTVKGGDRGGAFFLAVFGGIAAWYSFSTHDDKADV